MLGECINEYSYGAKRNSTMHERHNCKLPSNVNMQVGSAPIAAQGAISTIAAVSSNDLQQIRSSVEVSLRHGICALSISMR